MVGLTDTHAHIYLEEFKEEREAIITRAQRQNITRILMPNIEYESYKDMMEMQEKFPGYCIPMLGLHPCSVGEDYEKELERIFEFYEPDKFIAIGEIGLDLYWDKTLFEQQKEVLKWQCRFALDNNLPVALHTRNATRETIDVVKPYAEQGLKGVFHCFVDNEDIANEITKMGFYLGIGGVLTFKNSGLAATLKSVSLEHMVLETDSPYLAPVPYRGKRNEPSYVAIVAQHLAEIKNKSYSEIAEITTYNANQLFNLI